MSQRRPEFPAADPDDEWAYIIGRFTVREDALTWARERAIEYRRRMLVIRARWRGDRLWLVYPANKEWD